MIDGRRWDITLESDSNYWNTARYARDAMITELSPSR